jgi:hypothetical protein
MSWPASINLAFYKAVGWIVLQPTLLHHPAPAHHYVATYSFPAGIATSFFSAVSTSDTTIVVSTSGGPPLTAAQANAYQVGT